jgi:TonB family protein
MKTMRFCTLCTATCGLLLVARFSQAATSEITPLQIEQILAANYPPTLLQEGITSGEAWVMISVDETGKLMDALVIRTTHPALAAEALRVARALRYTPAKMNGEPLTVRTQLRLAFEATGQIITLDSVSASRRFMSFADKRIYTNEICTANELDRVPTPVHVVSPYHPGKAPNAVVAGGKTVLDFIIDETGQPRMPVVVSSPSPVFSTHATAALNQWRFTPPTRKGKPVAVQVEQEFVFPTDS